MGDIIIASLNIHTICNKVPILSPIFLDSSALLSCFTDDLHCFISVTLTFFIIF